MISNYKKTALDFFGSEEATEVSSSAGLFKRYCLSHETGQLLFVVLNLPAGIMVSCNAGY